MDAKVTVLKKTERKDLVASRLLIRIEGKDVDHSIVNTLRRVAIANIPMYAFAPELIEINKNSSALNNDQIRVRMCNVPLYQIDAKMDYLDPQYWLGVDFRNRERTQHPKDRETFEMFIKMENTKNEVVSVTSNDAKCYINNKEVQPFPKKHPHLFIKLRPGEEINMSARGVLATGERSSIWGAGHVYYEEDGKGYEMTLESSGQLKESDILKRACRNVVERLANLEKDLHAEYDSSDAAKGDRVLIKLVGENHTLGNLLCTSIQKQSDVLFAGCGRKDMLLKEIDLNIVVKGKNPFQPVYTAIKHLTKLFQHLEKKF